MLGELVSVITEDRVRLDGFFSQSKQPNQTPYHTVILSHGLGSNFYSSRLLKYFAAGFHDLGLAVLIANSRGHDSLTTTIRSGRATSLGAAYEVVSECEFDLAAWSDFLLERGFGQQVLFGHSLGAIKSLYAQAHRPREAVKSIIGLSATRLSHKRLLNSPGRDQFLKMLEQARALVEAGKGSELMRVEFPFATWMAATCYLEKYGPEDKYNWLNFADEITIPTLLLYGKKELDENPAFDGMQLELDELCERSLLFEVRVVEGADHFYSAKFERAFEIVKNWLSD